MYEIFGEGGCSSEIVWLWYGSLALDGLGGSRSSVAFSSRFNIVIIPFEEDVRSKQQTGQQSQQSEGMDKTPERSDSVMGPHSHGLLAIPETRRF